MSYLISAVRNPVPGKTQQLLKTVVSDFENNIGRGIVTLGPTGIIIGNTPVESADALEKMHDAFLQGDHPAAESLAKQEADCSEPIRFLIREIVAQVDPSKRPSDPKYMQRFIMQSKPGEAVDLLDALLKNHEVSGGSFNITAIAGNPGRLIMTRPLAHFNEVRKATEMKALREDFKSRGGVDMFQHAASVEGRVARIVYINLD